MDLKEKFSRKKYSPEPRDVVFTIPNIISLLRIISIPIIAWLITEHSMVWALVVLALSFASDGLDGLIARKFNQVSKIGQLLDPIADRLLILCSILALGICHVVPWWMLILVALRDVTMAVLTVVLALRRKDRHRSAHDLDRRPHGGRYRTSDARVRNAALCGYLLCDLGHRTVLDGRNPVYASGYRAPTGGWTSKSSQVGKSERGRAVDPRKRHA